VEQVALPVDARPVGRQAELDLIATALAAAPRVGSAINVHGEPGIGKSVILAAAGGLARLRGLTVLAAAGSEAETHLPFAALHQLLQPPAR
jgi:predicted ATP-dependent serine protease